MAPCDSHSQVLLVRTAIVLPGYSWARSNEDRASITSYGFTLWKHDMFKKGPRSCRGSIHEGWCTGERIFLGGSRHFLQSQHGRHGKTWRGAKWGIQWQLQNLENYVLVTLVISSCALECLPRFQMMEQWLLSSCPKMLRRSGYWSLSYVPHFLTVHIWTSNDILLTVSNLRTSLRLNTWIPPISHQAAGRMKSLWVKKRKVLE